MTGQAPSEALAGRVAPGDADVDEGALVVPDRVGARARTGDVEAHRREVSEAMQRGRSAGVRGGRGRGRSCQMPSARGRCQVKPKSSTPTVEHAPLADPLHDRRREQGNDARRRVRPPVREQPEHISSCRHCRACPSRRSAPRCRSGACPRRRQHALLRSGGAAPRSRRHRASWAIRPSSTRLAAMPARAAPPRAIARGAHQPDHRLHFEHRHAQVTGATFKDPRSHLPARAGFGGDLGPRPA
jgi:hypothetical protein